MSERLYDVFISGPVYLILASYIPNNYLFLKIFVIITGLLTIFYNGQNYLYFTNQIDSPLLHNLTVETGKRQFHRIWNLVIMYPLLIYANYITKTKNKCFTNIIYIMIIIGWIYNAFYFLNI